MLEIGNTLREARMRRNLDITDCEAATKIRGKYLRALEEEHFEMLPGPTYVRGFLRTYSDHLGLDGRLVVEQYESQFERPREQTAYEEFLRRNRSRRRSREGRVLAIFSLLVMIGAVGLWVATGSHGSDPAREDPVGVISQPAMDLRFLTRNRSVELRVHRESADGPLIINPAMKPNRAEELTVAPPVWVELSAPGAVTLSIDESPVTIPSGVTSFRIVGPGRIEVDP